MPLAQQPEGASSLTESIEAKVVRLEVPIGLVNIFLTPVFRCNRSDRGGKHISSPDFGESCSVPCPIHRTNPSPQSLEFYLQNCTEMRNDPDLREGGEEQQGLGAKLLTMRGITLIRGLIDCERPSWEQHLDILGLNFRNVRIKFLCISISYSP
jgi:hypothetical protein